ncbi:Trm112 family protein [Pollutimonas harenae]|uniref:UPF0434 protein H0A62_13900 n=1 Tax=Pollutimonas harenae TaxID=657015 RepID=A0A853GWI1_9BURK|nr:Trm112 family protein [Pollutimonas harenae]NYT86701.1 Trm112 family protein [Pollutimonas harenae]TEA71353.1 Trm112 family protein [Pollutimonas harenae]
MESRLLEILACPLCKGALRHDRERQELVCQADKLAFPIRDGIPIMLEAEARDLAEPQSDQPKSAAEPA